MAIEPPEQGTTTLQRLQKFAESVGVDGDIALKWVSEHQDWMFAAEWGREAPDSPMAGAAAYGSDSEVTECIEQALRDARYGEDTAPGGAKVKPRLELLLLLDEHIRQWTQQRLDAQAHLPGETWRYLTGEGALQNFRGAILGEMLDISDMTPSENEEQSSVMVTAEPDGTPDIPVAPDAG